MDEIFANIPKTIEYLFQEQEENSCDKVLETISQALFQYTDEKGLGKEYLDRGRPCLGYYVTHILVRLRVSLSLTHTRTKQST